MTAPLKSLPMTPRAAPRSAVHDRSILVEAGAGSGKTAVMAGRIAMMLAEGIAPKSIAAVTFTELAASELLIRVREFVGDLAAGKIPPELRIASARRPVRCAAAQSRRRQRSDRRNHLLDHPRLLPAADQALSGRGRHRSRRDRDGSQPGRSRFHRDRRDLAARAALGRRWRASSPRWCLQDPGRDRRADPQDPRQPAQAAGP